MTSNEIKEALASDLASFSNNLRAGNIDDFLVEPTELDNRDDIVDRHVSIYLGTRSPNISVESAQDFDTVQEIIVQPYVQAKRQKGSEGAFEKLFDDICDDIFDWFQDLAKSNRIYTLTNGTLRVPARRENKFFTDQEEVFRVGKSTYTRYHIEPIRNSN